MPTITLPGGRPVEVGADQIGQGINSNLTGTVPGGYSPAYGGVPQIPNPIASQWQAIGGDINSLPSLFSLGNAYNLFNYDQRLGQVAGTPGFGSVLSNLGGQIPKDVADRVAMQGAQRGISTGLTGSSNSDASLLRAMGLTSLDLQKLGQQQYGDLLGHFQGAAPFDISKFLVTPEDQQAANTAANVSAAAPNPQQAALEEFRKLMEAIQAGKANSAGAGGGGIPSIADLLNGLKNQSKPYVEPGNTVLNSLAKGTVPAGTDQISNAWRNQYAPVTQPGRPADQIQGSNNLPIMGQGPSYGLPYPGAGQVSSGAPTGNWWESSDPYSSLSNIDWSNPQALDALGPSFGDPWGLTQQQQGNAPSDWWAQSDPYASLSNTDWLNYPDQGNSAPWADTAPWMPGSSGGAGGMELPNELTQALGSLGDIFNNQPDPWSFFSYYQ